MKGHYIIYGYGDVGKAVAAEFKREGVNFVVMDRDPEQTESAFEEDVPHLVGDAADEVLIALGSEEHLDRLRRFVEVGEAD